MVKREKESEELLNHMIEWANKHDIPPYEAGELAINLARTLRKELEERNDVYRD